MNDDQEAAAHYTNELMMHGTKLLMDLPPEELWTHATEIKLLAQRLQEIFARREAHARSEAGRR